MPAWACLQTKDGKGVARAETAEEFEDNMLLVAENAQRLQQQHPGWLASGITYSWDNAAFHTRAHLLSAVAQRLRIPPRSPDIHKVIEHAFHPVKAGFSSAFSHGRGVKSVKQAMKLLQRVVGDAVSAEAVERDVASIRATLQSIITNNGGWASPGLR